MFIELLLSTPNLLYNMHIKCDVHHIHGMYYVPIHGQYAYLVFLYSCVYISGTLPWSGQVTLLFVLFTVSALGRFYYTVLTQVWIQFCMDTTIEDGRETFSYSLLFTKHSHQTIFNMIPSI